MFHHSSTLPHTLVPLALAVHVVWSQAFEGRVPGASKKDEVLNTIAAQLTAKSKIYEYLPDANTRPRALTPSELQGGTWVDGGREIRFEDGRPAKRHLAIAAKDVTTAIALMRAS